MFLFLEKDCALLVLFSVPVSASPAKHVRLNGWMNNEWLVGEALKLRGEWDVEMDW